MSEIKDIDRENWVLFRKIDITNDEGELYLRRWEILRTPWFSIKLHKFMRGDEDRCLHDHPWPFITFILTKGYWEETTNGTFWRKPRRLYYRPAEWKHRVILKESPTWTFVITGSNQRSWGFWRNGEWIYWKDFLTNPKMRDSC